MRGEDFAERVVGVSGFPCAPHGVQPSRARRTACSTRARPRCVIMVTAEGSAWVVRTLRRGAERPPTGASVSSAELGATPVPAFLPEH